MANKRKRRSLMPYQVPDPTTRSNFDILAKNEREVFRRMDKKRYELSDSCGVWSTETQVPTYVRPTNLVVKIKCTGRPVLITLKGVVDRSNSSIGSIATGVGTYFTAGGIEIFARDNEAAYFGIIVNDVTDKRMVDAFILGVNGGALANPSDAFVKYSPGAVSTIDLSPSVGIHEYEIKVAFQTDVFIAPPPAINPLGYINNCGLLAMELF